MSLTKEEKDSIERLLQRWLVRVRVALKAYNQATTRAVAMEYRLGVPAVVLSALVATGVFATLESNPATGWRIATGLVAGLAATLTALQTFLRSAERAEQFHEAARGYGRLRRRIEQALLFLPETRKDATDLLTEIANELGETSVGKPNVSHAIWDRAEYLVKGTSDARAQRALLLWLRERLHFGVADGQGPLPEDHERYFDLDGAKVVALTAITPLTEADEKPEAVFQARRRMRRAAAGRASRRAPLAVVEGASGSYRLVDGKASFEVARQEGWRTVPVVVVVTDEPAAGEDR